MAVPAPASSSSSAPWWAHVLIGTVAIGSGFGLLIFGFLAGTSAVELGGATLVGSGVTFLGVGSGVAASS